MLTCMFKAIIFDFDGTIVDSEPLHFDITRHIFSDFGVNLEAGIHQQDCIGYPDLDNFRRISNKFQLGLDEIELQSLVDKKLQLFRAAAKNQARTYQGVIPLIKSAVHHYPLAICTGSRKADVDNMLPHLDSEDISRYFKHIITFDDVINSKPDPACYRLAANKLNVLPQDCLAIEDSPAGIISAKAAGMTVLAVTHTHSKEKLTLADYCIDSLAGFTLEKILNLNA